MGLGGAYFPSGVYALYRPRRAMTRGASHNRGAFSEGRSSVVCRRGQGFNVYSRAGKGHCDA